ncbi:MAG TPA: PAS domain-containing protein, partial [Kofleriaceae bacterium]|nr:PAS domain-containing protein [Kofleriaceae bacterium]
MEDVERPRLELVADSLPGLVGFVDRDTRYQYVNAAYEAWFGKPRAFFVGKRIRDIVAPEMYGKIAASVERALAGERVQFRDRVAYPTGTRDIDVQYMPVRDSSGAQLGFAVLVLDIT